MFPTDFDNHPPDHMPPLPKPHPNTKAPTSPSWLLWIWAVVLVVFVYLALVLRYHYRHPKSVSILQCTADTFSAELLRERVPVVCSAFDETSMYQTLSSADWKPSRSDEVYIRMQHFAPRFGEPRPIRAHTPDSASEPPTATTTRSLSDVRLLVQLRGVSRVWLVSPQELQRHQQSRKSSDANRDPEFVEIVLRPGHAVFVPFLWGLQVVREPGGELLSEDTSTATATASVSDCTYADIRWDNWVLEQMSAHRWIVGE